MKYYWQLFLFKIGWSDWRPFKPPNYISNKKVYIHRIPGNATITLPEGLEVDMEKLKK